MQQPLALWVSPLTAVDSYVDVELLGPSLQWPLHEFQSRYGQSVDAVGVLKGSLPLCWCDKLLAPTLVALPLAVGAVAAADDLTAPCKVVRAELDAKFNTLGTASAAALTEPLKDTYEALLATDAEFRVEIAVIDCCVGEGALLRLQQRTLAVLPAAVDRNARAEAIGQALAGLTSPSAYRLASKTGQLQADLTARMAKNILEGVQLDLDACRGDSHMTAILRRLEFLCMHVETAGASEAPRVRQGVATLEAHIDAAERIAAPAAVGMADVAPLRVWAHLLTAPVQERAKRLEEALAARVTSVRAKGKRVAGKPKPSQDSAMAEAWGLFQN